MNQFRIELANVRVPVNPEESIALAVQAIDQASIMGARIICFPECYVPGYRGLGKFVPPPDAGFLDRAWSDLAEASAKANIAVILGTERIVDGELKATAVVINPDGSIDGFQDKVQIDPSEEGTYSPGTGRHGDGQSCSSLQICLVTALATRAGGIAISFMTWSRIA